MHRRRIEHGGCTNKANLVSTEAKKRIAPSMRRVFVTAKYLVLSTAAKTLIARLIGGPHAVLAIG